MKSARIEIILLIAVLFIAVAANEAPLVYPQKGSEGGAWYYPPIYPRSVSKYDGWVLESGEFTNVGGTMDSISQVVNVGDDTFRRQYRTILHFNTAPYSIPPTAIIYKATIRIRLQGVVGSVPTLTFGRVLVDIKKPVFGMVPLEISDFQAAAGRYQIGSFVRLPSSPWFRATLNSVGRAYINKAGYNQFRLYFKLDDDNDKIADYLKFFSGNATTVSYRPSLELNYYVP